ncbi:hypothetical protein [Bdellovibrio sp. HCB274]|uniref:hypothetical protein n=1 Tax=Bdellovibrio sp. HCB274 TaxID=3394361 RepID=UPI0039B53359
MKEFGPKIYYKSFLSYIRYGVGYGKLLALVCLPIVGVFFVLGLASMASPQKLEIEPFDNAVIVSLVLIYILFFGIMVLQRNQNFELAGDELIDKFPITRKYKVFHVKRVILDSPFRGHLQVKSPSDNLSGGLYWAGGSEDEWKYFVSALATIDPSIFEKVYFNRSKWKAPTFEKVRLEDSYKKILDVYKK